MAIKKEKIEEKWKKKGKNKNLPVGIDNFETIIKKRLILFLIRLI